MSRSARGIRRSHVDRSEIFVATKLRIGDSDYEQALLNVDGCLRRLGLDYIDLSIPFLGAGLKRVGASASMLSIKTAPRVNRRSTSRLQTARDHPKS
jgi:hypothetical protein